MACSLARAGRGGGGKKEPDYHNFCVNLMEPLFVVDTLLDLHSPLHYVRALCIHKHTKRHHHRSLFGFPVLDQARRAPPLPVVFVANVTLTPRVTWLRGTPAINNGGTLHSGPEASLAALLHLIE